MFSRHLPTLNISSAVYALLSIFSTYKAYSSDLLRGAFGFYCCVGAINSCFAFDGTNENSVQNIMALYGLKSNHATYVIAPLFMNGSGLEFYLKYLL